MDIKEIRSRIDKMAKEMALMEKKLIDAITIAVYEAAQENPNKLKRISEHIVTVRYSDVIGNPWNYEFYDWEKSAKVVMEFLNGKPLKNWKSLLKSKLAQSKGNVVAFEKTIYLNGYKKNYSIPVNKLFIQKILERI